MLEMEHINSLLKEEGDEENSIKEYILKFLFKNLNFSDYKPTGSEIRFLLEKYMSFLQQNIILRVIYNKYTYNVNLGTNCLGEKHVMRSNLLLTDSIFKNYYYLKKRT